MKRFLLPFAAALALSLAACAAPAPVAFSHQGGTMTISELGDSGQVVGAWEVDASSVFIDPNTDVLTCKYIPHPLRSYRIARNP